MRHVPFAVSLCLLLGACALPDRRPEADFDVRDCPNPGPTPAGTPVKLGAVVNHHECLTLDASESAVFTGSAKYQWEATVTPGDTAGGPPRTMVLGSAATVQGIFFRDFPIDLAVVDLTLTVTDGEGQRRTKSEQLNLLNRPPRITVPPRIVKPRGLDLLFNPFLVVRGATVEDPDCDYLPGAVESDPRVCDTSDVHVFHVDADGAPLHGSRCSDVPARTGGALPDPFPEDPAAWCFDIFPRDDVRTPEQEDLTRASAFSFQEEALDFRFRFEAVDRGVPVNTASTECFSDVPGAEESVGCQTVRYEDAVWIASARAGTDENDDASGLDTGFIGRIAPDWRRKQSGVLPFFAAGTAKDRNLLQWLGALASATDSCLAAETCPGALVGYDEAASPRRITGLGTILGIEADPLGGLWIAARSVDSAGNPSANVAGGPRFAPGETYAVLVPEASMPSAFGAPLDLTNTSPTSLVFLSGFGAETPMRIAPTDSGDLWIATQLPGGPLDTFGVPGTLRVLDAGALVPGTVIDLQSIPAVAPNAACGGVAWAFPPTGYADVLASAGNGGIWTIDVDADSSGYPRSKVCQLDKTGGVQHVGVIAALASSIAFDPGTPGAGGIPARSDSLFVADAAQQAMVVIPDVTAAGLNLPEGTFVYGFPGVLALAVDDYGGVWADSHPVESFRTPIYLSPSRDEVIASETFASLGRGIEASSIFQRSSWRADLITDVVRAPAASEEIPALEVGSAGIRIIGVDPIDAAAYAISPNPTGDNFFRIGANGGVTPLGDLGGRPLGGMMIPELLSVDFALPATLWISMVYEEAPFTRLVSISIDRLRQMADEGNRIDGIQFCGPNVLFEDRSTIALLPPCWLQEVPAQLDATNIDADEMVLSFDSNRLLMYLLGRRPDSPSTGRTLAVLNPLAPYNASPSMIALTTLTTAEVVPSRHPMFVADTGVEGAEVPGIWIAELDGDLRRWRVADPMTTTTTTLDPQELFPVPAILPGYRAIAGANDRINHALWVTYAKVGEPTELMRFNHKAGEDLTAVVLNSAQQLQLSGGGEVLAVAPFTGLVWASFGGFGSPWLGSVWSSGRDGTVVRVSTLHFGSYSLAEEYVRTQRPADFPGSRQTPSGFSIQAGGF